MNMMMLKNVLLFLDIDNEKLKIRSCRCVEFFNKFHPDPNETEEDVKNFDEQFPDGMFRFEKRIY